MSRQTPCVVHRGNAALGLAARSSVEEHCIDLVSTMLDLDRDVILSESRNRQVVTARALVAGALAHAGWSQPAIARTLRYRDHTSVHHLLQKALPKLLANPDQAAAFSEIRDEVSARASSRARDSQLRERGEIGVSRVVDMLRAQADVRLTRLEAGLREQLARDPDALLQALERLAGEAETAAPLLELPRRRRVARAWCGGAL